MLLVRNQWILVVKQRVLVSRALAAPTEHVRTHILVHRRLHVDLLINQFLLLPLHL